jgi:Leucine-rich repeat (LRR) protein
MSYQPLLKRIDLSFLPPTLDFNQVEECSHLKSFDFAALAAACGSQLQFLIVKNCKLSMQIDLTETLARFPALHECDLSRNRLVSAPGVQCWKARRSLRELDLSHNPRLCQNVLFN